MKKGLLTCLATGLIMLSAVGIAEAISIDNFAVSSEAYSVFGNTDATIDSIFGNDYRLADWNDIVQYYNEGNDMTDFTSLIPGRTMVSLNGSEFWTSNRHYFINISNHSTPSGFLVHASLDNHLIDLGSWYNDRFILAYTDTPDPVPEPATMLLVGTGIVGLAGTRLRRKKK